MLDMPRVREVFEASTDFTVGLEEEFAILDPSTLTLDQRFEDLRSAGQEDAVLA
jgi:glutamate---cysteine ligase / carboxylate-amine ligase